MPAPCADIAAHLIAGSPLAGVTLTSANVFAGPLPPSTSVPRGTTTVPNQAIGCYLAGGENTPLLGGGKTRIREPVATVQVRSAPDGFTSGEALAQAAQSRCNATSPTGYISWLATEPAYRGPDEQGAHRWEFTIQLRYMEVVP